MTNAGFTELEQYRDLESINLYHQRVDEAKVQSSESMLAALAIMGRDNARTPMQWDATAYAGFTEPDASQVPWIAVNPNCVAINAESEQGDPDSVYAFYRKLIRLRHENPVIAAGDWRPLDAHGDRVYAFTRSVAYAGDAANGIDVASHGGRRDDAPASQPPLRRILVVANLSSTHVAVPAETAALLGVRGAGPDRITGAAVEMGGAPASRAAGSADGCVDADIIKAANVLIGTYAPEQTVASLRAGELAPWEAFAYRID
jgi:oligo-1,6-glucosidase